MSSTQTLKRVAAAARTLLRGTNAPLHHWCVLQSRGEKERGWFSPLLTKVQDLCTACWTPLVMDIVTLWTGAWTDAEQTDGKKIPTKSHHCFPSAACFRIPLVLRPGQVLAKKVLCVSCHLSPFASIWLLFLSRALEALWAAALVRQQLPTAVPPCPCLKMQRHYSKRVNRVCVEIPALEHLKLNIPNEFTFLTESFCVSVPYL